MGDRTDTGGLATALQLLGAAGHAVPGAGGDGQAELFEAEAPLPLPLAARPAEGGKLGRPAGARNKSTDEWVRYFLGRYRSPMTALAEIYSRDLGQLVDDLQAMADKHHRFRPGKYGDMEEKVLINPADVLRLQRDAAMALLPYIHKKQPLALEVDKRVRGVVVLGSLDTAGGDGSNDLALPFGQVVEHQQVTDAETMKSDGHKVGRDELFKDDRGLAGAGD